MEIFNLDTWSDTCDKLTLLRIPKDWLYDGVKLEQCHVTTTEVKEKAMEELYVKGATLVKIEQEKRK